MRKLIALILILSMLGPKSEVAQARASDNRDGLRLSYTVTISQPATHLAHVRIEAAEINYSTVSFGLSLREASFLSNLTVLDLAGRTLPFSLTGGSLSIEMEGSTTALINYDIEPSDWFGSDASREYTSYVTTAYAMVQTWSLLFTPYQAIAEISVSFSLPPGWTAVTPWAEANGFFHATDLDDLMKRIALGPFEVLELTSAGVPVRLGIQQGAPKETIIADTLALFSSELSVFDDFPYERFMAAFAASNVPPFHNGGAAAQNSFYMPSEYRRPVLAHEMFHMWLGAAICPASQSELWFQEGGTEFYQTDARIKTGLLAPVFYVGDYAWFDETVRQLEQSLGVSLLEASQRAMAEGGPIKDFAYYKGRLFVFLLNQLISAASNGDKSMDDVMRYLYQHFNRLRGGRCITNDDLLTAIEAVAGREFDSEFALYLYGRTSIAIAEYFQDSDQDGLAQAIEGRYRTNPIRVDSDGDGLSDGAEVAVWHTGPLVADSFHDGNPDGQRVQVKADGRGGGWGAIAPAVADRQGDTSCSVPGADLRALYLATDGYYLYISLAFYEPPTNHDLLYQLHLDTDLDGQLDYYLVQRPDRFIGFGEYHSGTDTDLDAAPIRSLTALAMDYLVPWHLIGSPTQVNLGFRVRPVIEDVSLDELDTPGYWLRVNVRELTRVGNSITFRNHHWLPLVARSR